MRAHYRPHFMQKTTALRRFFNVVVHTISFAAIDLVVERKKNRYFYGISRQSTLFARFYTP